MVRTAVTSVIEYIRAAAKGNAVKRPITRGNNMTLGTFLPGFGISSHMWAPQSLPRYEKTALPIASMKAQPSLDQPVWLVVSVKMKLAEEWLLRATTKRVRVVAPRVSADKRKMSLFIKGTNLEAKTLKATASQIKAT